MKRTLTTCQNPQRATVARTSSSRRLLNPRRVLVTLEKTFRCLGCRVRMTILGIRPSFDKKSHMGPVKWSRRLLLL